MPFYFVNVKIISSMEKKKKNRIIGLGVVAGTALLTAAPFVAVRVAYDKAFNHHISTYDPLFFSMDDFPSLRRDKHIFTSNNKQKLTGYMYYYPEVTQKAVIVLSHGYGGGGQRTYLDCTNYLAKNGFYVFAYDASGTDESEGKMGGFPQGIIDVNHAIDYVSSLKDFKQYPIFLFGHSWGAYSASNALAFHPEIKAIVAISGFNKSTDLIKERGHVYSAGNEQALMPYVDGYEYDTFGELSNSTAIDAFTKSNAKVFIVHSGDDLTVPMSTGYELYYEKFKDDPRFKFTLFEDRGHGTVYYSKEGVNYTKEFYKKWNEFLKTNPSEEQKLEFVKNNIDRSVWNNRYNEDLWKDIIVFYNESLN